jgi:hypothetical protein
MAGVGSEQIRFPSRNQQVGFGCCADFSAKPADPLDVLARAVALVAGMSIPQADRETVLAKVVAALAPSRKPR